MCYLEKERSIELEDGRVLRHIEGMPSIDVIIDSLEKDVNRFKTEIGSPYCTLDRKESLLKEVNDFEFVIDGWKRMKEQNNKEVH